MLIYGQPCDKCGFDRFPVVSKSGQFICPCCGNVEAE